MRKMHNSVNINRIIKCPLCHSNKILILESFESSNLIDFYRNKYDYDISKLINCCALITLFKCNNCHLKYFYPCIPGDEKFYNRLQLERNYYLKEKQEYDYVEKYFSKDEDVLEIGTGNGSFAKKIEGHQYTGLELSTNAVLMGKKENIPIYHQTIQEYSSNNSLKHDVVVTFQVLEHVNIEELKTFIESALNVLKKGGKLIISVPADDSFVGSIPNMTLNLPPHHLTRWPDMTFKKMEGIFNIKIIAIYNDYLREKNYNAYLKLVVLDLFKSKHRIVKPKYTFYEKLIQKIIKYTNKSIKKMIINT